MVLPSSVVNVFGVDFGFSSCAVRPEAEALQFRIPVKAILVELNPVVVGLENPVELDKKRGPSCHRSSLETFVAVP